MPATPNSPDKAPNIFALPQTILGWGYVLLSIVLAVTIGWLYFHAGDMELMGFTHDDGVYAVAGKSLAQGKGFKLLHVIGEPNQIKYPIVYPLILAGIWKVFPAFPENLPLMHGVTIVFSVVGCWLAFLYLWRAQRLPGWLALLIVALTCGNFFFIYFFSDVMSEGPFLCFTMLTLCILHWRLQQAKPLGTRTMVILALLSVLCFHTRVLGLALMLAIGTWLLLQRAWKSALVYGGLCLALGLLPWSLWVKWSTPPITKWNYPIVNAYSNYGLEFIHNMTATNYLKNISGDFFSLITKSLEVTFPLLPNAAKIYPVLKQYPDLNNNLVLASLIGSYLFFGYFILQMVHTVKESIQPKKFSASSFSVPALYLFYYVTIITLWNYEDQLTRFLTPVLPLIWLYFFKPFLKMLPNGKSSWLTHPYRSSIAITLVALIAVASLWPAAGAYKTISLARTQHWVESGKYRWMWNEYKSTFSWINQNLPPKANLSGASDVVFYLYTNRPTFYVFYASLRRKNGQFTKESIPLLMESLDYYKVQYLVVEPHMQFRSVRAPMNKVAKQLLTQYPERFEPVYSSPRGAINIFKIVPNSLQLGTSGH